VNRRGAAPGPDCGGQPLTSSGYNLSGTYYGCFVVGDTTGNITGDAMLGPLQDNGGPTKTHVPLPGSPALDAGNPAPPGSGGGACDLTDQRGVRSEERRVGKEARTGQGAAAAKCSPADR